MIVSVKDTGSAETLPPTLDLAAIATCTPGSRVGNNGRVAGVTAACTDIRCVGRGRGGRRCLWPACVAKEPVVVVPVRTGPLDDPIQLCIERLLRLEKESPCNGMGRVLSEWGWKERNFNTAWIQVVPKTPLSRARTHNFGQFPS